MTKTVEVVEEVETGTEVKENLHEAEEVQTQPEQSESETVEDAAEGETAELAADEVEPDVAEGDVEENASAANAAEEFAYERDNPEAPWLLSCIESLVFVSNQPLTVQRVVEVLKGERVRVDKDVVRGAFKNLMAQWEDGERQLATGFQLVEVAKGLSFRTVMDNARFVRRFFAERPQRLSRAQLETLAIISYRQPATRGQVEEIRGVDCGSALRTLLDKNLIKVLGKSEEIGRPWIYGTTKYFLSFFGLKSLHDLPALQEVQELDVENKEKLRSILGDDEEKNMIMELFDPEKAGALVSDDTEQLSQLALGELEEAVGFATEVVKRVNEGPKKEVASAEEGAEEASADAQMPAPPEQQSETGTDAPV